MTGLLVAGAATALATPTNGWHDDATVIAAAPEHVGSQPILPPAAPPIPPLASSPPQSLLIPSIGLSVPLTSLGLNADGTVEVPSDYEQAGWYRNGPTPGENGSAVILGHVDSYQGPAVFFHLNALRPGDRVTVTRVDGSTAVFAVTAVDTYLKTQFPAQQVYANNDGSHLQLVTCGGEFDSQARSYRSNVVVYTSLVASSPGTPPIEPIDSSPHPPL